MANEYATAVADLIGRRFGRLIVDQLSTRKGPETSRYWLCVCDCGNVARVCGTYLKNSTTKSCGCLRREHMRKYSNGRPGALHPAWKGGRNGRGQGYMQVLIDGRYVAEHRHVMEQHLGRALLPGETVHHKNGVRDDNRLENLELWSSSQPPGQRVEDKLAWAHEIIALYGEVFRG